MSNNCYSQLCFVRIIRNLVIAQLRCLEEFNPSTPEVINFLFLIAIPILHLEKRSCEQRSLSVMGCYLDVNQIILYGIQKEND